MHPTHKEMRETLQDIARDEAHPTQPGEPYNGQYVSAGDRYCAASDLLEDNHRRAWRRFAWINAVLVWLAVAAFIIVQACGCSVVRHPMPPHGAGRTVEEQGTAAIQLDTFCIGGDPLSGMPAVMTGHTGTGVMIGEATALTAHHVVECQPGFATLTIAEDVYGERHKVAIIETDNDHDISKIAVGGDTSLLISPVHIASVRPHERLCQSAMEPQRTRRCGEVVEITAMRLATTELEQVMATTVKTEHGNSGSALYDERGYLVGITTNLRMCNPLNECGGLAPALYGLPIGGDL